MSWIALLKNSLKLANLDERCLLGLLLFTADRLLLLDALVN